MAENLYIPEISGPLRSFMLKVPEEIQQASGIRVMGKLIKSIVFTTDICIIRNVNADAVIAVYPFTPQPIITQTIMSAADIPVFTGVGGGLTQGKRVVNLSMHAEFQGAIGVVVNAPTSNDVVRQVCDTIDIPVVVTVISEHEDIESIRRRQDNKCGKRNTQASPRHSDYRNGRTYKRVDPCDY